MNSAKPASGALSSLDNFRLQRFNFTKLPLFPRTPPFPRSSPPLLFSSLHINPKSKFLAIVGFTYGYARIIPSGCRIIRQTNSHNLMRGSIPLSSRTSLHRMDGSWDAGLVPSTAKCTVEVHHRE